MNQKKKTKVKNTASWSKAGKFIKAFGKPLATVGISVIVAVVTKKWPNNDK